MPRKPKPDPASPEAQLRLLAAQVRAGDEKTIKRVVSVLKKAGGDIPKTAENLGVAVRTIHRWRAECPAFAAAFDEESRGLGRPALSEKEREERKVARALARKKKAKKKAKAAE